MNRTSPQKRNVFPAIVLLLVASLSTSPVAAADYAIDTIHSSAVFKISHLGASNFYGMFNDVSGTVSYDESNPEGGSIDITISATSVDTRNEDRDNHVKSPDFLNAKQFPTITFKSKSFKKRSDGKLDVTGDLTLLGVTQSITVQAEKTGEGKNPRSGAELIGFEAQFTVDRTQHDMGFMAGPLGKDIGFILAIEAVKQ